jgi:hypothetical protein
MKRSVRGPRSCIDDSIDHGRVTCREGYCRRKDANGRLPGSTHASGGNGRGKAGRWRDFASSGRSVRNAPLLDVKPQGWNCHAPVIGYRLSLCLVWNESRTNRARIADSGPVGIRSRQYVVALALLTTKSCKGPGNGCNKRSPSITGSAGSPKFAVRSSGDARRIIASSPSPCSVAASR